MLGVSVGVEETVAVGDSVGVFVTVLDGVWVAVELGVPVTVLVAVLVGVEVITGVSVGAAGLDGALLSHPTMKATGSNAMKNKQAIIFFTMTSPKIYFESHSYS